MPTFFHRPENALKRANEFIDVGKKNRALDALYDVIKSKKHRTWQKIHEPIMEKYLTLCVELKKSHIAKEGLYQYKNICQQVNIKSLEDVVRKYLSMAEEKTDDARKESHQAVVDVDDLDIIISPENLLLSAVSGEDTQDRTDRAILTPWVKFLWESYRQCLDLLRNNSSVEKLYQDIARDAFKFCLKYERKTEFRKLCDNLRTHLGHIHKHQHQHRAINLEDPDSQAMHLETRLVQLNSAIQMELWQEAFKAVEDIHGLITKPKKQPKPSLMANYYSKLGLVFWKSGNHLFHACAWHRLFHLSLEQRKNLSPNELVKLSSRVLCATLSIPIPASRTHVDQLVEMDETAQEKQRRLATLLGLQNPPTRQQLVRDLYKYNIFSNVHEELRNLYQWLEVEFHPLKLSNRIAGPLNFIGGKDDLAQYVPALQDITITRLLKQVSQVYETIEFDRLAKLAPFASGYRLERIIVDTARNLELQVRIDHRSRTISFGTDLGVAQKEDVPEGPYLQAMPSETIRNQLTSMAHCLHRATELIQPQHDGRDDFRQQIMQKYRQVARSEHARILQRRQIIEERKEELENINTQREQKEMELVEEQRRRQYEAEMARLEKEAEERERQRRIDEHNEIKKRAARERLDQLKSTELGAKAFADLKEEEIAGMDVDDILAKQVEQLEKEKKELHEKLKSQEKKVDYLERAKRLEEIPFLKEQYEQFKVKDQEWFDQQERERIELQKKERELALEHRDRLNIMRADKDDFLNRLKKDRMSLYKEKLVDFEKSSKEERKRRLEDRKLRRKEDRRTAWIKAKEEEAQRKRDEEAKRKREEEERLEQERRDQEEAEYHEKVRKLEEIEEKKRQRERELEEKMRLEARDRDMDDNRDGSGWRPSGKSGGWRDRVREKDDSWKKPRDDDMDDRRDDQRGGDDDSSWRRDTPRRDLDRDDKRDFRRDLDRDDRRDIRRDLDRDDRRDFRRDVDDRRGDDRRDIRRDFDKDDRRKDDRRDFGGGGGRDDSWRQQRDEPREDKGGAWRRDDRGGGRDERGGGRDDRGGGSDDAWRRGGDDRGGGRDDGWRRGGDDRGGRGGDDRAGRGGDDRAGRDDGWRRGGEEKSSRGGDAWRRGEERGGGREERGGGREERGGGREERGGGRWGDRQDGGESGGGGAWRRGTDDRSARDDGQDSWRKAGASDRTQSRVDEPKPAPAPPREEQEPQTEDDGWTTVSGRKF